MSDPINYFDFVKEFAAVLGHEISNLEFEEAKRNNSKQKFSNDHVGVPFYAIQVRKDLAEHAIVASNLLNFEEKYYNSEYYKQIRKYTDHLRTSLFDIVATQINRSTKSQTPNRHPLKLLVSKDEVALAVRVIDNEFGMINSNLRSHVLQHLQDQAEEYREKSKNPIYRFFLAIARIQKPEIVHPIDITRQSIVEYIASLTEPTNPLRGLIRYPPPLEEIRDIVSYRSGHRLFDANP